MADTNTLAVVNASIALVSTLLPEVAALVLGLKTIWTRENPGKTEADWIASLTDASAQLTSEADAQLVSDGYTKDAAGNWVPPTKP